MKKVALLASSLFAVMIAPFASAWFGSVEYAARDLIETARELIAPFLEVLVGEYYTSEFFFAKVLLLVLVFVMVQFAIKKVPQFSEKKAVVNIVAAVVSILSIRYIQDNDFFNLILLPYGALGIALTAIIPFLIYFYFVHNALMGPVGRRLAWIFFIIVFCALWFTRSNDIGMIGDQIYGWTLAAVAIAFVFDKNIHYYFGVNEDWKRRRDIFDAQIANIDTDLARLYKNENPTPEVEKVIESLEKRRKNLKKHR